MIAPCIKLGKSGHVSHSLCQSENEALFPFSLPLKVISVLHCDHCCVDLGTGSLAFIANIFSESAPTILYAHSISQMLLPLLGKSVYPAGKARKFGFDSVTLLPCGLLVCQCAWFL